MDVEARGRRPDRTSSAERLIDAAERLVAVHGVDGVSDRSIVAASGHRNNSAIAYHFGDRHGLLDAVWHRRTTLVRQRRIAVLAGREPEDLDRAEIVRTWIQPITDEMAALQPSYWARFNDRMLEQRPLVFLAGVRTDLVSFEGDLPFDTLLRLLNQLEKLTLGGTQPFSDERVALTVRFVIGSLAAWERDNDAGREPRPLQEFTDDLSAMADALLDSPPGSPASSDPGA